MERQSFKRMNTLNRQIKQSIAQNCNHVVHLAGKLLESGPIQVGLPNLRLTFPGHT